MRRFVAVWPAVDNLVDVWHCDPRVAAHERIAATRRTVFPQSRQRLVLAADGVREMSEAVIEVDHGIVRFELRVAFSCGKIPP